MGADLKGKYLSTLIPTSLSETVGAPLKGLVQPFYDAKYESKWYQVEQKLTLNINPNPNRDRLGNLSIQWVMDYQPLRRSWTINHFVTAGPSREHYRPPWQARCPRLLLRHLSNSK